MTVGERHCSHCGQRTELQARVVCEGSGKVVPLMRVSLYAQFLNVVTLLLILLAHILTQWVRT